MLFKNAKGFMVEAEAPLTDPVQFHPQGGGFVYSTPKAKFETNFSPAPKPAMRKVRVTGDWMDDDADPIEAFANDMRWNGWAMPYFALENAKLVTATMPDITYRIAPQCSIHNALAASAAQRRSRRAWMVVKRRTLLASREQEIQLGGCPASTAGYAGPHACEGAQRKLRRPRPRSAAQGSAVGLPLAGTAPELSLSGNLHP